ncbi:MAG: transcriptional regulator [Gammaproteobacteria bacterium]|nr:MAG: transcriptional regulator [Gammaproteobacteria bacterium]
MYRKDLIDLLLDNPTSLVEIARFLEMAPRDVEDDLHHLQKSLKHSEYRLLIHPAICRKCGFKFKKDKIHKPGKCPLCHKTWIKEPLLEVVKH